MTGRTEKSAYIILITHFFKSSVWGNGREQNGLFILTTKIHCQ